MDACARTYVTLCIYAKDENTFQEIGNVVNLKPTKISQRGGLWGWFLSTKDIILSKECGEHLSYLIDVIKKNNINLDSLQERGCVCRVFCFWESAVGNGGPVLTPSVMAALAEFNLELHFDIWFEPPEDGNAE